MPKENGNTPQSEEDEKMLNGSGGEIAGDKEVLTQKNEVKFQSESQNGDAKIDIEDGPDKKVKIIKSNIYWINYRPLNEHEK